MLSEVCSVSMDILIISQQVYSVIVNVVTTDRQLVCKGFVRNTLRLGEKKKTIVFNAKGNCEKILNIEINNIYAENLL